jgi:hypothetical protein
LNEYAHGFRSGLTLVGWFIACAAIGCSSDNRLDVSGTATFDGVAVERGEISFIPREGGSPDGGVIEQGKFQFAAKPGEKRVEIRASRPVPTERQSNPEMGLMYEDYIPARYNTATTLTATVSPDGERVYEFTMSTQP